MLSLMHILHIKAKYMHEKKTCAYKQELTGNLIFKKIQLKTFKEKEKKTNKKLLNKNFPFFKKLDYIPQKT